MPGGYAVYFLTVLGLILVGLGTVGALLWLRPSEDNSLIISMIVGFLTPTTIAFLGLLKGQQDAARAAVERAASVENRIEDLSLKVDGRLTQLLKLTESNAQAVGRDEERANPTGPVVITDLSEPAPPAPHLTD